MRTLAALGLLAVLSAQPALAQTNRDDPSARSGNAEENSKPTSNTGGGGGSGGSNN